MQPRRHRGRTWSFSLLSERVLRLSALSNSLQSAGSGFRIRCLRESNIHLPKYVFAPNRQVSDEEELFPAFPYVGLDPIVCAPRLLENRLRTTLTHEYGHVLLHGFLFAVEDDLKKLFDGKPKETRNQPDGSHPKLFLIVPETPVLETDFETRELEVGQTSSFISTGSTTSVPVIQQLYAR